MLAIVTVNYNNQDGLAKTICSICEQTEKNFYWIFVDGGSDDESVNFAKLSKIDKKIIHSGRDGGIYDAMNIGTSMVPDFCSYIIYMNSGDVFFDENVVKEFYAVREKSLDSDVIYGASLEETGFGDRLKNSKPSYMIYFGMIAHHQAMFFKKSVDIFYDINVSVAADYSLVCKLYGCGKKFFRYKGVVCKFGKPGMSLDKAGDGRRQASIARKFFLGTSEVFEAKIIFLQKIIFFLKKTTGYFR